MTSGLPSDEHPAGDQNLNPRGRGSIPVYGWLIIALSVTGIAIYIVVDHWPHVLAALPYLGIIALAAMHMFGHRGHGGAHGGHRDAARRGADHGEPP